MGAVQLVEGLAVALGKPPNLEQRTLVALGVSLPRNSECPGLPLVLPTTAGSESPDAGGNREAP